MLKVGIKRILSCLLLAGALVVITVARADELNIGNAPLYLGTNIDPNVFFEVDDSGSMDWEVLTSAFWYYAEYWRSSNNPEEVTSGRARGKSSNGRCSGSRRDFTYMFDTSDNLYQSGCSFPELEEAPNALERDWRSRSSQFNAMYYDPSVTYLPWPGMPNADYTIVRSNPQSGTTGYNIIRDLSNIDFVYEEVIDDHGYSGTAPKGPDTAIDGVNKQVDLWDSHKRHTVQNNGTQLLIEDFKTAAAAVINGLPDCTNTDATDTIPYKNCFGTSKTSSTIQGSAKDFYGRTITEIKQNIANWYQYHRRRSFVAKAAVAEVIKANSSFRYGLSVINKSDQLFIKVPASSVTDYNSHNDKLLDDFFSFEWPARGTPLRKGLESVGKYYDAAVTSSGVDEPIIETCQHNFAVLFTDGYWNGSDPSLSTVDADGDGLNKSTVADVAKFYYDKDLNNTMDDEVRVLVNEQNQIMHQHMETFTVAFGVTGNIAPNPTGGWWPEYVENSGFSWGDPFTDTLAKIDDLWHAAYNSNARYISARTPKQVTESLVETLGIIEDKAGSSASVATNTGALSEGSRIYQARFHPANWSGQLYAFNLDATTGEIANEAWDAGEILTNSSPSGRKIITYNEASNKGVNFIWPSNYLALTDYTFSAEQVTELLSVGIAPYPANTTSSPEISENQAFGAALISYLRGDRSNEQSGSAYDFRTRGGTLGDIVNSNPQFMGKPRSRYPDDLEGVTESSKYSNFVSSNSSRRSVLYVGANDGLLHAFDSDTGEELLAYAPSSVFKNLGNLADPRYFHRYYVDGSPALNDAYIGGSWHTILAGGLNGGGQGVYVLDVTNPDKFSTDPADDLVLFEFTDANDADLGLTYARPAIVKMNNDEWVAIFGNGYNNTAVDGHASTTGRASLFIVSLENTDASGKPRYWKLDTGVGSSLAPNGLASAAVIDFDGDAKADYVYGGDLLGNIWKFDITGASASSWKVGLSGNPLFTTKDGQPVTGQPTVSLHPDGLRGVFVYFGTGKYIEQNDDNPNGQTTQSFYALWDRNIALGKFGGVGGPSLLEQTVTEQKDAIISVEITNADGTTGTETKTVSIRKTSDNAINWSSHKGWYIDLKHPSDGNLGEKQITKALFRQGKIFFTTLVPSQAVCSSGGRSFLMSLCARNGGACSASFDLNEDGEFDSEDSVDGQYVAGVGSDSIGSGITTSVNGVTIIAEPHPDPGGDGDGDGDGDTGGGGGGGNGGEPAQCGGSNLIHAYQSFSDGSLGHSLLSRGSDSCGRQSWRMLKIR